MIHYNYYNYYYISSSTTMTGIGQTEQLPYEGWGTQRRIGTGKNLERGNPYHTE